MTTNAQEQMVPISQVKQLISEVEAKYQQPNPVSAVKSEVPDVSAEEIEAYIKNIAAETVKASLNEVTQERKKNELEETMSNFIKKIGIEAKPFPGEIDAIIREKGYNYKYLSSVAPVISEMENARELTEYLILNADKLISVYNAKKVSNTAAKKALNRINEEVKILNGNKAKVNSHQEPLIPLPRAAGGEASPSKASEFRRFYNR